MKNEMRTVDYESIALYYSRCLAGLRKLEDYCCSLEIPDFAVIESLGRLIESFENELPCINGFVGRDIDIIEEFINYED